ncbi:hypothetical protein ACWEQ0_16690 [Nocardia thailandica]
MAYGSLAWVGRALAPLRESMTADLVRTIEQVVPVIDIDPDLAGLRAASIAAPRPARADATQRNCSTPSTPV